MPCAKLLPARRVERIIRPHLFGSVKTMNTLTTNYLDIIERLPAGALLRLQNVDWDEYEHLLTQMDSHPGHRLSYNCGRLIIVSPSLEHERYKVFAHRLIDILSEEMGLDIEPAGATTFKSKLLRKGLEPDECVYVQNAAHIIGKRGIRLDEDPPPDVAVEIDMSNDSIDKLPIYAALGVPEIWRYDGKVAHFYKLAGENYEVTHESIAFPGFSAQDFGQYLGRSGVEGYTAAAKAFRRMLRSRASS
jgi:Uma2 family endonuclease